jgi:hypothetical protein
MAEPNPGLLRRSQVHYLGELAALALGRISVARFPLLFLGRHFFSEII